MIEFVLVAAACVIAFAFFVIIFVAGWMLFICYLDRTGKDNLCRIRLCATNKLIADGLVKIGTEKKNCPSKFILMRLYICPKEGCERERHELYSDEERREWRKKVVRHGMDREIVK